MCFGTRAIPENFGAPRILYGILSRAERAMYGVYGYRYIPPDMGHAADTDRRTHNIQHAAALGLLCCCAGYAARSSSLE